MGEEEKRIYGSGGGRNLREGGYLEDPGVNGNSTRKELR
jgi:hypothetical protein